VVCSEAASRLWSGAILNHALTKRTPVSDIFDEVSEDLRADRTRALLRRYGAWLIAAAVAVVLATAGYEAWSAHRKTAADQDAAKFLAASDIADGPADKRRDALPALLDLAQNGSGGYRTLARLRAAGVLADSHDLPAALAQWDGVSADTSVDADLRSFADLQWAMHQIDQGDVAIVETRLQKLTGKGGTWRALALEGEALLAIRQGQTDRARDLLKALTADTTATDSVRGRAAGLLQQIGG